MCVCICFCVYAGVCKHIIFSRISVGVHAVKSVCVCVCFSVNKTGETEQSTSLEIAESV